MSGRENYKPGPAAGAEVLKDGEKWTLVLVRELRHPPEKVWQALTEPAVDLTRFSGHITVTQRGVQNVEERQ